MSVMGKVSTCASFNLLLMQVGEQVDKCREREKKKGSSGIARTACRWTRVISPQRLEVTLTCWRISETSLVYNRYRDPESCDRVKMSPALTRDDRLTHVSDCRQIR